jgi:hypothetical protein
MGFMNLDFEHLDRSAFSVACLGEDDDEQQSFWLSRTPEERLAAMEFMRQVMYGYDPISDRIQRVLEVAELGES